MAMNSATTPLIIIYHPYSPITMIQSGLYLQMESMRKLGYRLDEIISLVFRETTMKHVMLINNMIIIQSPTKRWRALHRIFTVEYNCNAPTGVLHQMVAIVLVLNR